MDELLPMILMVLTSLFALLVALLGWIGRGLVERVRQIELDQVEIRSELKHLADVLPKRRGDWADIANNLREVLVDETR